MGLQRVRDDLATKQQNNKTEEYRDGGKIRAEKPQRKLPTQMKKLSKKGKGRRKRERRKKISMEFSNMPIQFSKVENAMLIGL